MLHANIKPIIIHASFMQYSNFVVYFYWKF